MALTEHQRDKAWTEIWYINDGAYDAIEKERLDALRDFLNDILEQSRVEDSDGYLPPPDYTESERPSEEPSPFEDSVHNPEHYFFGARKKWIPYAEDAVSGVRRGDYAAGYPEGAVVHWTAGHRNGLDAGAKLQRDTRMLYLIIDKDGNVAQTRDLSDWGYHAGASKHFGASGYVSDEYIGIELQAAGHLTKLDGHYYPWWDKDPKTKRFRKLKKNQIPESEVLQVKKRGNIAGGYYHVYTQAQMTGLRKLLCWLHLNDPSMFSLDKIVGHDEVSPGRKVDPGGALIDKEGNAITMKQFRDWIKEDIRIIRENAGK